ncbi:MAG TPA: (2Fe-2S) ferredoxin domain-containing protein [Syntrophorhabdaceae bacterium]|nr:(2Fe-2S) ferredoxin domain-containing protein [Syntrophorhabdaceae bacterium]
MKKPKHHILVCGSFRANGTPQGICNKKNSMTLLPYIERELSDRGMNDVVVSSTGCLKMCEAGPALVVYPENWWYGSVDSESVIDEILDGLEAGKKVEAYAIA